MMTKPRRKSSRVAAAWQAEPVTEIDANQPPRATYRDFMYRFPYHTSLGDTVRHVGFEGRTMVFQALGGATAEPSHGTSHG
jgi:hypothetical protein